MAENEERAAVLSGKIYDIWHRATTTGCWRASSSRILGHTSGAGLRCVLSVVSGRGVGLVVAGLVLLTRYQGLPSWWW